MKEALLFILKNWKIFLPVFSLIIGLVYFLKRRVEKRKSYKLETLIKNKLGNSHTVIKKNKILFPNASSAEFSSKINLICELQQDPYIINCIGKNNSIFFERANFKKSKKINPNPEPNELGINHKNKVFCPDNPNTLIGLPSGAGKTVLLNNKIYSYYKSNKGKNFEIIIADSHSSFLQLKNIPNISIYSLEMPEEKEAFLKRLEEIKKYQKEIDLSVYENLTEAQKNGEMNDKKSFLIIVDEFLENYSSPNNKHKDYKLNQDTLKAIEDLLTSGRKYNQQVFVAYQAELNSEALISPNLFNSQIFGFMNQETAGAKSLPTTHTLLKIKGTFYFISKNSEPYFFRTYPIFKSDLPKLLGGKNDT